MNKVRNLVIETHGLSKSFGAVQALRGVELRVTCHSIFGFLGLNGAGKTSLMKILLRLPIATTATWCIVFSVVALAKCERTGF